MPRLTLNLDDNELFNRIVTAAPDDPDPQPLRASHQRLLAARDEAHKQVRKIVSPLDAKEHGDRLNSWVSFIEHRAVVVLLRVPDDANAYRMFETLNDLAFARRRQTSSRTTCSLGPVGASMRSRIDGHGCAERWNRLQTIRT